MAIGRPWMLGTTADLVLVADALPPLMHVFDAASAHRLRSLFEQGEGPGDFATAPSILRSESTSDTLWLLDPILRRLTGIPFGSLTPPGAVVGLVTLPVGPDRPMSLVRLPDASLFGVTVSAMRELNLARITHVDGNAVIRTSVSLPINDDRFLKAELSKAYTSRACAAPDGRVAGIVYNSAGRIDIVGTTDATVVPARVPYSFFPPVTVREGTGEAVFSGGHPEGRSAYMDCHGTDDRLYALFQGMPWNASPDSVALPPSELHEFDWRGRLLRITVLDHSTFTFTLDQDRMRLLTLHEGPNGWELRSTSGDWR